MWRWAVIFFCQGCTRLEESERETHDLHELEYVHSIALLSIRFPQRISILRRVTVPPERANRLPCMVAFPNYSTVVSTVPLFCALYLFFDIDPSSGKLFCCHIHQFSQCFSPRFCPGLSSLPAQKSAHLRNYRYRPYEYAVIFSGIAFAACFPDRLCRRLGYQFPFYRYQALFGCSITVCCPYLFLFHSSFSLLVSSMNSAFGLFLPIFLVGRNGLFFGNTCI